ncbi:hypothetical protein BDP55DRAFT_631048 [Colletotrichum godetiae]|uniref:FAD linked oxidase N-terminal domain-containing protein n=1 Tax=Colletotrichum godetiae TaxID=1209918 RepID=A0AAJ0AN66_9PEZI|nr:uncharacterized protein BDP55DRAFT_631048 [Colletotrichum godetiae]KAK1676969.1 hypothetical protein BDP55DRAFT_631048 [Colletotrichum godetiae]
MENELNDQLFLAGDAEYSRTLNTYYSGESSDMKSQCILQPETTEQSVAISAGGHSNFPASNTNSGVTIDLANLKTISLEGNETVSVGGGNRWGDVYRFLEPKGLMTAGGRENTVGVSGVLLGGGFSWFSGEVGFAADNVAEYEARIISDPIRVLDAYFVPHRSFWPAAVLSGPAETRTLTCSRL